MAIASFNEYIYSLDSNNNTIDKENLTIDYLYAHYIQWLIENNIENIEVCVLDLLKQLYVIVTFVRHELSKNTMDQQIVLTALPEEQLNSALNTVSVEMSKISSNIETYIDAVKIPVNKTLGINRAIDAIATFVTGCTSAIFIGAAFAPQLASANVISLLVGGSLFGVLALASLTKFASAQSTISGIQHKKDLATNIAVESIARYTSEDTKNAVKATLSATTSAVLINSNIYNEESKTYTGEYAGLKPYIVELEHIKLTPKLK